MVKRHRSQNSRARSVTDLRFKFKRIVHRHERMKASFHLLKLQIKASLVEAEDVFASLSIPLMRLVGLKTEEMADEGRSSTISMDYDVPRDSWRSVAGYETPSSSSFPAEFIDRVSSLDEESVSFRASKAGKELLEKQRLQFEQLVHLLRRIEAHVNSRQNDLFHTLDNHRASFRKFFKRAVSYLSNIHRPSQSHDTALLVTIKLLRATFDHVGASLSFVESGVEAILRELAEQMCNPMVEYVKGLKTEMASGTSARMVALVEEMEIVMRDRWLQMEEARNRVKVEELRKLQALRRLRDSEDERRKLKEFLGYLLQAKAKKRSNEPFVSMSPKLFGILGDQADDERLLWKYLKEQHTSEAQAWPEGPTKLPMVEPTSVQCSKDVVGRRPIIWSYGRALDSSTPFLESTPRLGSSPSNG